RRTRRSRVHAVPHLGSGPAGHRCARTHGRAADRRLGDRRVRGSARPDGCLEARDRLGLLAPRAQYPITESSGEHMNYPAPPVHHGQSVPRPVAIVVDGNGRWANQRGLPRTEGHRAGEASLLDVIHGAIEAGVDYLSAYAFSTENWKRSPEEVRFLMGFNRDVLRRRRDEMNALGVRVRWAGQRPRLWKSVISELEEAEQLTRDNTVMTLAMCVNYGGRSEIVDAVREIAEEARAGHLSGRGITEASLARRLNDPDMPDVDLFIRTSGEQRTSNFLLWQSAYAELVFVEELWPDV